MSLVDTLKNLVGKGREVATENAGKIHEVVDKAEGFIDEKTGGKYSEQIHKGAEALKNVVPEPEKAPEAEEPKTEAEEPKAQATPEPAPTPESAPAPEPTAASEPAPEPPAESASSQD